MKKEIKARRKLEAELKLAKEEAEKANQIKSLFLARMSHEIRTPLSAIMGMTYLIKKTNVNPTQSSYLDKLTEAAKNMLDIINDILDFSKIEAGKIEIEKVSFDLDKVIMQVFNIVSVKAEEKNIEIVLDKEPSILTLFLGDPVRIQQIFLNVLNNAIKFTSEGSVSLTVKILSQEGNICKMEFCIRDTGIGMSTDQVDRLFVPFDQGDSSISRRFGGTGLGLSIAKNLTDLMNGEIEVESSIGKGSAFYIRLPLEVDMGKNEDEIRKSLVEAFAGIHALVIDKNKSDVNLFEKILTSFGIKADFALSVEEGIAKIEDNIKYSEKKYNLLILDSLTSSKSPMILFNKLKKAKRVLIVPMTREVIFEEQEDYEIDFVITKPIISSTVYNGIIEIFNIGETADKEISESEENVVTSYPYRILLVEDNKTNQFIANKILEQAGLRVILASDGEEGYKAFLDNRDDLDLILMDIHMPVMDGYSSADLIRKVDKDIPIVAMTADAIVGTVQTCKKHGMDNYVSKPFEPEKLIDTIFGLLKGKKEEKIVEYPDNVLDYEDGKKRIGGDSTIFNLVLGEYLKENLDVEADLKEQIDNKDYEQAIQIVHKNKSSSGNIGAKSLFEIGSELQKALQEKDDDEIIKKHVIFSELLKKVLEEIKNII